MYVQAHRRSAKWRWPFDLMCVVCRLQLAPLGVGVIGLRHREARSRAPRIPQTPPAQWKNPVLQQVLCPVMRTPKLDRQRGVLTDIS